MIKNKLTFLLTQFTVAELLTFVATVFAFFVDTISVTIIFSSHSGTKVPAILFKYLLFPKIHVLGFHCAIHLQSH